MSVDSLREKGWCLLHSSLSLLEISSQFGKAVPCRAGEAPISLLRVQEKEDANNNSLSSRFGASRFPFHSDGAYMPEVPKYVIMRQITGFKPPCPTELIDLKGKLSAKQTSILKSERWKFGAGHKAFIDTVISPKGLRYDPAIMRPAVSELRQAPEILNSILENTRAEKIAWEKDLVLVIDNHRMLHTRGSNANLSKERILERILVL